MLRKIGKFIFSYARKATAGGLLGGGLLTAVAADPEVNDALSDSFLSAVTGLPVWLQAILYVGVIFATIYYPPNGPKP